MWHARGVVVAGARVAGPEMEPLHDETQKWAKGCEVACCYTQPSFELRPDHDVGRVPCLALAGGSARQLVMLLTQEVAFKEQRQVSESHRTSNCGQDSQEEDRHQDQLDSHAHL